jgi:hypothetical protein
MIPEELAEIETLEARRADLASQASSIDASLSQKRRYDPDGTMWDVERYSRWRSSAIYAKTQTNKEPRQVKERLRMLKAKRHAGLVAQPHAANLLELIARAHDLLVRLKADDVDFDPGEIAVIEDLRKARGLP